MASALLPTDTFRFLIGGTRASVGLISGYLLKEIPRTFRLSFLLRKVHAPGRLDGNFWGLGVHPLLPGRRVGEASPVLLLSSLQAVGPHHELRDIRDSGGVAAGCMAPRRTYAGGARHARFPPPGAHRRRGGWPRRSGCRCTPAPSASPSCAGRTLVAPRGSGGLVHMTVALPQSRYRWRSRRNGCGSRIGRVPRPFLLVAYSLANVNATQFTAT